MSLNLTSTKSEPAAIARLPDTMLETLRQYAYAQNVKKEAEKTARDADKVLKQHMAAIVAAMGDAETAVCGSAVVSMKRGSATEAALTLVNGVKVAWSVVTGVLKGNEHIPAADIATIYGGRSGSVTLDVKGV